MNRFVSGMQWVHGALAAIGHGWVRLNLWAGRQWEKLRPRKKVSALPDAKCREGV